MVKYVIGQNIELLDREIREEMQQKLFKFGMPEMYSNLIAALSTIKSNNNGDELQKKLEEFAMGILENNHQVEKKIRICLYLLIF